MNADKELGASTLQKHCIFCLGELTLDVTPEHILHNALGGRMVTREVICSNCNNAFGGKIDKKFVEQFNHFRNLLQVKSGSGGPPPMIRNVKSMGKELDIRQDGSLHDKKRPFVVKKTTEGGFHLDISVESSEELLKHIPHIASACQISEKQLRNLLSTSSNFLIEQRNKTVINFSIKFGESEAFRSVAKSCLVLWTTLVGNDEVVSDKYQNAIKFVNGILEIYYEGNAILDSRVYQDKEGILSEYGDFYCMIYVKSNEYGRVVGRFTVYNLISFTIILAASGGVRNQQIGLISNPLNGLWSNQIAETLNLPFDWLDNPEFDQTMSSTSNQIEIIMKKYRENTLKREGNRIIDDVLKSETFELGESLTLETAKVLAKQIADRLTQYLYDLPTEQSISAEKIRKMLNDLKLS